jgi:hypothetical protein
MKKLSNYVPLKSLGLTNLIVSILLCYSLWEIQCGKKKLGSMGATFIVIKKREEMTIVWLLCNKFENYIYGLWFLNVLCETLKIPPHYFSSCIKK